MGNPAKKNRRANGIATCARILEAAEKRFAETGYAGTSLRQIANDSTVDLATLKYHFGDKAALFGEVYRRGHDNLLSILEPLAEQLEQIHSAGRLVAVLEAQIGLVFRFLTENERFVRMGLFRLLERPSEVIPVQDQLEADLIDLVETALGRLRDGGIVRTVDTRGLVVLLLTAIPSWYVSAMARPTWIEEDGKALEARFKDFFLDLTRQLVVET